MRRTASRDNPEALQGFHAEHLLFLIDEASGIDDIVFEVGMGALSTPGAKVVMQETRRGLRASSTTHITAIHDRMPAILERATYNRWLGLEPDPHDLLIAYPSDPMTMWPISTRVNAPENDDASLLDRTGDPFDVWAPLKAEGRA